MIICDAVPRIVAIGRWHLYPEHVYTGKLSFILENNFLKSMGD
jgi:hypothetical protein